MSSRDWLIGDISMITDVNVNGEQTSALRGVTRTAWQQVGITGRM